MLAPEFKVLRLVHSILEIFIVNGKRLKVGSVQIKRDGDVVEETVILQRSLKHTHPYCASGTNAARRSVESV